MCGIVGLLVKKPALREQLGELMMPMLIGMTERGPDSAGLAVFNDTVDVDHRKISIYSGFTEAGEDFDWNGLVHGLREHLVIDARVHARGNHAVLTVSGEPEAARHWIKEHHPKLHLLSTGRSISVFKDVGTPAEVADRYDFKSLKGSHVVAHTRMATESAITADRAHPFTAGEDFCLIHNGSLSNAAGLRRKLEPLGIHFETDNDTEAACRYIEWRLGEGDTLHQALDHAFKELDGFYTLLMATSDQLALVRDPFACKPAVVAEHDDYVAIASEFRSLAHLPGIRDAKVFEPGPEEMYVWKA